MKGWNLYKSKVESAGAARLPDLELIVVDALIVGSPFDEKGRLTLKGSQVGKGGLPPITFQRLDRSHPASEQYHLHQDSHPVVPQ
jgi:hypothetical protein